MRSEAMPEGLIAAGNSIIVLGEAGTDKTDLAVAVHEEMSNEFNSAIATYKGSIKKFFIAIAMQLGCPTEDENDKAMTVDALKEEILINSNENTLLVFPEAKRLTTSIRYWLEDMISAGVRVVCFAVANPGRDIFLMQSLQRVIDPQRAASLFRYVRD